MTVMSVDTIVLTGMSWRVAVSDFKLDKRWGTQSGMPHPDLHSRLSWSWCCWFPLHEETIEWLCYLCCVETAQTKQCEAPQHPRPCACAWSSLPLSCWAPDRMLRLELPSLDLCYISLQSAPDYWGWQMLVILKMNLILYCSNPRPWHICE